MMNATKKNETVRFTIDFLNRQIVGTKASFNKASKGYGSEYEELMAKMAKHPDFELVVKEQKHKSTKAKRTYDGMDFSFMEAFIAAQKDSKSLMKEYEAVKAMAKTSSGKVYPLTKKWFLDKFSTEGKPFDMDAAREAISEYQIAMAVKDTAKQDDSTEQNEANGQAAKAA